MITSIQNPRIKTIRDLLGSKKERDTSRLMVLEGVRLAEEALKSGLGITQCLFSTNLSSRGNSVLEQIR
jgi:tRNA G18 (ribose-2'-O)-methylase SpoU